MIRIDISETDVASSCGHVVRSGKGPIGTLARKLVAEGYAEHDIAQIYRGSMKVFRDVHLGEWAKWSWREGDMSVKRVRYVPMPSDLHEMPA